MISGFHHVAFRCKDASETVKFYRDILGLEFSLAIAEDHVPSTGEYSPYMHIFLKVGQANLAFFELPEESEMSRDLQTPTWVQHIALKLDSERELLKYKQKLESAGHEVLGPIDHGIFTSIYFHDPSGHRIELAADTALKYKGRLAVDELKALAEPMLEEWARTRRPPKHAQWLHKSKCLN